MSFGLRCSRGGQVNTGNLLATKWKKRRSKSRDMRLRQVDIVDIYDVSEEDTGEGSTVIQPSLSSGNSTNGLSLSCGDMQTTLAKIRRGERGRTLR